MKHYLSFVLYFVRYSIKILYLFMTRINHFENELSYFNYFFLHLNLHSNQS